MSNFFISLKIIWGVVISFDVLKVFGLVSVSNIHGRLNTHKEIWIKLGFSPFNLILHSHFELLAHSK